MTPEEAALKLLEYAGITSAETGSSTVIVKMGGDQTTVTLP